jgi:hypothetical protein
MVSVDLEVTFKTADGVLNEALTANARIGGGLANMGFQADLPAAKIAGTYPVVVGPRDQIKLVFSGHFEGNQYTGSISELSQTVSIPGGSWVETGAGVDASTDH